jgi:hypothetical protein
MWLQVFLATALSANKCNNQSPFDSLNIYSASANGAMKKASFTSNNKLVTVWSSNEISSKLKSASFESKAIEIKNFCDYQALASLDPIDCASVDGVLDSIRYKLYNSSFEARNIGESFLYSVNTKYTCAILPNVGECKNIDSFIEIGVGCDAGWFLQNFHLKIHNQNELVVENRCCRVNSLNKRAIYANDGRSSSFNLEKRSDKLKELLSTFKVKNQIPMPTSSWFSLKKQVLYVSAENAADLKGQKVACGSGEYLNYLDFQ